MDRIKNYTVKKFAVFYIALYLIIILPEDFSAVAQDTPVFTRERPSDVKIQSFCNNTVGKDFAPFVWHDNIFIVSSRRTLKDINKLDPGSKQPFLNVYAFGSDCNFIDLKFLPSSLNANRNCGPLTIAGDTSLMVITKNYNKADKEGVQNNYLLFYVRDKKKWSKEKMFPFNHVNYSLQHPYFDDQTKTLYFSSDLPGGYGKFDIYKSRWDGKSWSKPVNLGPKINSSYNEVFPSLYPGGGLMYSCDQRGNSGGFDLVFYSDNKRYLLPAPFSTTYDDFSISFLSKSSGYFASNRDRSTSEDNIYYFEIVSSFIIRVLDRDTKMAIQDVNVAFKAKNPLLDSHIVTSGTGEGLIYKGNNDPFSVSLELKKEGYLPQSIVSDNFLQEDNSRVLTLIMESIPEETTCPTVGEDKAQVYDHYFIIVGSFRNLLQAQNKAEKLKNDFNTNFIVLPPGKEGYYRISYGEYTTLEEAKSTSERIKAEISSDVWIYSEK